jgi:ABC-2 type transport system permease protein
VINDFQGFQLVTSFFTMPLFFLSNSIFPIAVLPSYIQFIMYLNPLTYGVDGLRNALLPAGSAALPMWIDLVALLISSAIMLSIAVYAFSKTEAG